MKNNNKNNVNVSIAHALRKRCYEKGISLYDNKTLGPKTQTRLVSECSRSGKNLNNIQNFNTMVYGVPPRPERARAIRGADPKMSVGNAFMLSADPFYGFKNWRYVPDLPKNIKNTYGHEIWGVLPEFFPGPKNKPAPKKKASAVAQPKKKASAVAQPKKKASKK